LRLALNIVKDLFISIGKEFQI